MKYVYIVLWEEFDGLEQTSVTAYDDEEVAVDNMERWFKMAEDTRDIYGCVRRTGNLITVFDADSIIIEKWQVKKLRVLSI